MEQKYFNFPIQLLQGFLINEAYCKQCLHNILHYGIYHRARSLESGEIGDRIKTAADFLSVGNITIKTIKQRGEELMNSIPERPPMVGIGTKIFWDFRNNKKSDFEKVCLLAFLALKSINRSQPYGKADNNFLFARMAGFPVRFKSKDWQKELPEKLQEYTTRWKTTKIIEELELNWGLVYYAHYTRGFYFSFSMTLDDLVLQVEKRRKSKRQKDLKMKKKEARERVIRALNGQ
jgi:hypothetical protein